MLEKTILKISENELFGSFAVYFLSFWESKCNFGSFAILGSVHLHLFGGPTRVLTIHPWQSKLRGLWGWPKHGLVFTNMTNEPPKKWPIYCNPKKCMKKDIQRAVPKTWLVIAAMTFTSGWFLYHLMSSFLGGTHWAAQLNLQCWTPKDFDIFLNINLLMVNPLYTCSCPVQNDEIDHFYM